MGASGTSIRDGTPAANRAQLRPRFGGLPARARLVVASAASPSRRMRAIEAERFRGSQFPLHLACGIETRPLPVRQDASVGVGVIVSMAEQTFAFRPSGSLHNEIGRRTDRPARALPLWLPTWTEPNSRTRHGIRVQLPISGAFRGGQIRHLNRLLVTPSGQHKTERLVTRTSSFLGIRSQRSALNLLVYRLDLLSAMLRPMCNASTQATVSSCCRRKGKQGKLVQRSLRG